MAKKEKTVVPEIVDSVEALEAKMKQCAKHRKFSRHLLRSRLTDFL